MKRETIELVNALKAVTSHIPRIGNDLLIGQMPPAKQREYADLLSELVALLRAHADDQDQAASGE